MNKNELPRLMKKPLAMRYCGNISMPAFDRLVKKGVLPPKVTGTAGLWDRKAIDEWLDRAAGLKAKYEPGAMVDEKSPPEVQSYWLSKFDGDHQNQGREDLHVQG